VCFTKFLHRTADRDLPSGCAPN
jgi:hypothetical protein